MMGVAILIALQVATPGPAAKPTTLWGVGSKTCEEMSTPDNRETMLGWEMAFWTGLNVGRGSDIGGAMEGPEIGADIQKACNADPSQTIAKATYDTFKLLAAGH